MTITQYVLISVKQVALRHVIKHNSYINIHCLCFTLTLMHWYLCTKIQT